MRGAFHWLLGFFASPVGLVALAALDSTLFFSLPFGIDAAVVVASARAGSLAWTVALLATAGSIAGAAFTYWMGRKIGEQGLDRYVAPKRLGRIRGRIQKTGAVTLAVLDLIPPPFPYTLFILAAGALKVDSTSFFGTLAVCRLVRFGLEAILAARYGGRILAWLDSEVIYDLVAGCVLIAIAAGVVTAVRRARVSRRVAFSSR